MIPTADIAASVTATHIARALATSAPIVAIATHPDAPIATIRPHRAGRASTLTLAERTIEDLDPDALRWLIAHEIAHTTPPITARRRARWCVIGAIALVVGAAIILAFPDAYLAARIVISVLGAGVTFLLVEAYAGRGEEYACDAIALQLTSPHAMRAALDYLAAQHPHGLLTRALSAHPSIARRRSRSGP